MKALTAILVALALSGCATNGEFDGKKTAALVGMVIVGGYIAVENADSGGNDTKQNCYIVVGPGGSSQVCN